MRSLGPLQRKLVDTLRSGEYPDSLTPLVLQDEHGLSPLGVAVLVAEQSDDDVTKIRRHRNGRLEGSSLQLHIGVNMAFAFHYSPQAAPFFHARIDQREAADRIEANPEHYFLRER